jgi:Holliday junction resolvase RusA-like endonuclease
MHTNFFYSFDSFYGLNQQLNLARTNKYKQATKKKELTNQFVADTLCQVGYEKLFFPLKKCVMSVVFTVPNKKIDVDNLFASLKPILDALVKAGVLVGDNINVITAIDSVTWRSQSAGKKYDVLITLEWDT